MPAALIQCGGGHAPQSSGESVNGSGASNSSGAINSTVTLSSITVTPTSPSIILSSGTAQTQQFTATGNYSDGSTKNLTASVTWSSSAPSIATITSGGNATVLAFGTTTISAALGTISGSTALTIVSTTSLKSIQVTPTSQSILLGASGQFLAQGTNVDGSTQNLTASVTWASSAVTVATISNTPGSNGKITSVAAGETTITATLGSLTGSAILTVTSPTLNPLAYTTPVVAVLPASIALDASGNIWVTNFGVNSVIMLPTALTSSGGVVPSPIPSPTTYSINGSSPFGIAIDYVGNIWTANYSSGDLAMIDLNQPAYDATVCPTAPINSSGGLFFYRFGSGSLSGPHGIAIDSSRNVWVTNYSSNTVSMLIPNYTFCQSSAQHPATVTIPQANIVSYTVGNNPYGIAIDSSGNVWVTNYTDGTVSEISTSCSSSGNVCPPLKVGANPQGIAIDPLGNVWVVNSGDNTISEISKNCSSSGNVYAVCPAFSPVDKNGNKVLNGPHSIAIETSGNVWVTNYGSTIVPGNTIAELCGSNTANCPLASSTGSLISTYTVGKNPEGVSIDFWGNVWVTNYYDNTLTVWSGVTTGPHFNPYAGPIWPE